MASYFKYNILEFSVETSAGFIDLTETVSTIEYTENITSPVAYVAIQVANTSGVLSKLKIRGGEQVRLIIEHPGTKGKLKLDDDNQYYIYNISTITSESTRETFIIDLVPGEVFVNETTRVMNRYDYTLDASVTKILSDVLSTTRYNSSNIEKTVNNYSFMGNMKKPFTVLSWLCPKGIPQTPSGSSGNEKGTAGFLFYENKEGYNFKSVDSVCDSSRTAIANYVYKETVNAPASESTNFVITSPPIFKKSVDVLNNLRIGMYSSLNYFFDINTRKFYANTYKLTDSYDIMNHSGDDTAPLLPDNLQDSPSRLMVKMLDNGHMDKSGKLEKADKRMEYQAQSTSRYNLIFNQTLNITVPLNLELAVGYVVDVTFGKITLDDNEKGKKDKSKSGKYVISKLLHSFSGNRGLTGLELIRDSYGEPK